MPRGSSGIKSGRSSGYSNSDEEEDQPESTSNKKWFAGAILYIILYGICAWIYCGCPSENRHPLGILSIIFTPYLYIFHHIMFPQICKFEVRTVMPPKTRALCSYVPSFLKNSSQSATAGNTVSV